MASILINSSLNEFNKLAFSPQDVLNVLHKMVKLQNCLELELWKFEEGMTTKCLKLKNKCKEL